jgi:hypothetical protein
MVMGGGRCTIDGEPASCAMAESIDEMNVRNDMQRFKEGLGIKGGQSSGTAIALMSSSIQQAQVYASASVQNYVWGLGKQSDMV